MNTKRILCILQLPPPLHGVSLMNNYILNSKLIKSNFHIEIVDFRFAKSMKDLQKFSFSKIFKAIVYVYKIAKKVLIKKPDMVYFTLCPTGLGFYRDAFYVFILKLFGSKIVFHLHGKGIKQSAQKNFLRKWLYTWLFKNTFVICLSKKLADDISDVYKNTPYIVPNGIEVQPKFNRNVNQLNRSVPQILYLSNYIRNKGILILLEALEILKDQGYQFKARLVGAPTDLTIEFLENKITNQNLTEVVKIIGPRYGDNKFVEFQEADIFVFPTYNDAFPLVTIEAMQYCLPVISTFEGSIPDIVIDNETGFLVKTQDPQMLAEKIAILLNDKDLGIEMGKRGYERFMNNFTLNHFENKINEIFYEILGTH
ncbi:glycosyl transferase, group 1 family protein [Aquipluma nitroreducens]|uniref:Glycosyl transferase, group 1 family protein n=1 Tax=Aquipluma nitroreducens TaxID=2010828 RepID=A0A5K7SG15_9BACT|nr:glycosyltransferase family 4 protein [Aquipluma nitroreducens]BBE20572.1 glycosyl transferase, group 1 family protein [Aquipluma nitroreducens]